MGKWKTAHPGIALVILGAACAMTFSEVSAQNATFTTQQYPLLGNTHIAADLNGDGKVDLAGAGANVVSVMLGNGNGTFGAKTDFPVAAVPQAVAAGDFNSDGKVDLVATLNDPQLSLALLTGTGTGTFNPPIYFPNTSGFDSPAIAATDLNSDGKLDLAVRGAPGPRYSTKGIWTGSEMIAWGGLQTDSDTYTWTGGRYRPPQQ